MGKIVWHNEQPSTVIHLSELTYKPRNSSVTISETWWPFSSTEKAVTQMHNRAKAMKIEKPNLDIYRIEEGVSITMWDPDAVCFIMLAVGKKEIDPVFQYLVDGKPIF